MLELDKWLWESYQPTVMGRDSPHLTREELEKVMEWKITRGKFRPLMRLIKQNDPSTVKCVRVCWPYACVCMFLHVFACVCLRLPA